MLLLEPEGFKTDIELGIKISPGMELIIDINYYYYYTMVCLLSTFGFLSLLFLFFFFLTLTYYTRIDVDELVCKIERG